jgi:uncharacterized protein YdeI (YjbR/CyaY-like superfamily)
MTSRKPLVPDLAHIRAFEAGPAFEAWLAEHHDQATELYVRIYKKGAGVPTITYAEAIDAALCWGWIDGIRKGYDDASFLQRFTPRRPKSLWSQINREHVARLIASGRMTEHGLLHVNAAKADGRWEAAYAGGAKMQIAPELEAALARNERARALYDQLDKTNRYAFNWRVSTLKTPAGREKRAATVVQMLLDGATFHPVPKQRK